MQIPDSSIGNFDQPVLPIADPDRFKAVHAAIEAAFSPAKVTIFLQSLSSRSVRIRDFESVLANGLLGPSSRSQYDNLGHADQGQIREFYLATLEKVAPVLRDKFFKLYAYY